MHAAHGRGNLLCFQVGVFLSLSLYSPCLTLGYLCTAFLLQPDSNGCILRALLESGPDIDCPFSLMCPALIGVASASNLELRHGPDLNHMARSGLYHFFSFLSTFLHLRLPRSSFDPQSLPIFRRISPFILFPPSLFSPLNEGDFHRCLIFCDLTLRPF